MSTAERVNHTTIVKLQLNKIYITCYEAEADSRGFVLTRDSSYIARMERHIFMMTEQMSDLQDQIADNFSQKKNWHRLDHLLKQRTEFMVRIVADSHLGKIPTERWLKGRQIMTDLKNQIDKMITEETMLMKVRNKDLAKDTLVTPLLSIFLTVLALLILVASYLIIYKELAVSNALRQRLEQSREELVSFNDVLTKRNDALDAMNKELESFTYISSHDLQEPLRKIQTFISRVGEDKEDNFSDNSRRYLQRTQEAASRMQSLIQDLLAYSRVTKEVFSFEACDFREIANEVVDELSEEINASKASVSVKGKGKLRIIRVQFRQLMVNLVANAIKFHFPDVHPKVTITFEPVAEPFVSGRQYFGIFAKVSVSDNGIGIEDQYLERIFEVFQRLHTRDEYSGTGVGLAIVKKIVENHDGAIEVLSKPGKGTTFSVYLPMDKLD